MKDALTELQERAMQHSRPRLAGAVDPELQRGLAALATLGLDDLITALPNGHGLDSARVGALLRLIAQAAEIGGLS
jgi:hypothetical protein